MNKLEQLKAAIKELRNNTVHNLLIKSVEAGDTRMALYYTAGCLMYIQRDDVDREALETIRDILL